MNSLFISDLHLTPERPAIARAFLSFMKGRALTADALYILGDFFDYWVGDDAMEPFHDDIARALRAYSETGRKLYLMAGNRDFALGKTFLRQAGAMRLKDPCVIELNSEKVLLMHGDLLCTGDQQYLRYRKVIQNPLVLAMLRMTPLSYRKNLGKKIRANSKTAKSRKSLEIMDVSQDEVLRMMQKYRVKTLIHGHTHRPAIHTGESGGFNGRRVVLGDWESHGWLVSTERGLQLEKFEIPPD